MASYDIDINLWLQNAIEYRIEQYVREFIKNRDNLKEDDVVRITDITHSYGYVEVRWSYRTNPRVPNSYYNGTESFSLAEVLKICMTEYKQKES